MVTMPIYPPTSVGNESKTKEWRKKELDLCKIDTRYMSSGWKGSATSFFTDSKNLIKKLLIMYCF